MKITAQFWSELGSFGNPMDNTPDAHGTLHDVRDSFAAYVDEVARYYDMSEIAGNVSATCYRGDSVTEYPDFLLVVGRRGGIRRAAC